MTREAFLARPGSVFENRPDLAAAVWAPGPDFGSAPALHDAFAKVRHARGAPAAGAPRG